MHVGNNRVNHDFQIRYFLIGGCHTPDVAYGMLCDLEEDRANAIAMSRGSKERETAKRLRAAAVLRKYENSWFLKISRKFGFGRKLEEIPEYLEALADLNDIDAMVETSNRNLAAAEDELATIRFYKSALEQHRVYRHLPIREAHEAAQQEEWACELMHRAENSIVSIQHIPADQLNTMRMHPEFKTRILPHIDRVEKAYLAGPEEVKKILLGGPKFALPKLPSLEHLPIDAITVKEPPAYNLN